MDRIAALRDEGHTTAQIADVSRRTPEQHLWILWADEPELTRLRKLAASSHRGVVKYPAELIPPKRLEHG